MFGYSEGKDEYIEIITEVVQKNTEVDQKIMEVVRIRP